MSKLILICGKSDNLAANVEVIGQLLWAPADFSNLGKTIQAPKEGESDRLVFCNNDHFLNGLRVAVTRGTLDNNKVEIHFVDENGVKILNILPSGSISDGGMNQWPKGFFDQMIQDVAEIGRFRRGNRPT